MNGEPSERSLNEGVWRVNGKASEAVKGRRGIREDPRSGHDPGMVGEPKLPARLVSLDGAHGNTE